MALQSSPHRPPRKSRQALLAARDKALQAAYASAFGGEAGKTVLADLAARCFVASSTLTADSAVVIAANEGRRQVFLHIQTMLHLDVEALMALRQRAQDNQEEVY